MYNSFTTPSNITPEELEGMIIIDTNDDETSTHTFTTQGLSQLRRYLYIDSPITNEDLLSETVELEKEYRDMYATTSNRPLTTTEQVEELVHFYMI